MQAYGSANNANVLTIDVPPQWYGQFKTGGVAPNFWGRTGCRYDPVANRAQCETGGCGGQYDCSSANISPPPAPPWRSGLSTNTSMVRLSILQTSVPSTARTLPWTSHRAVAANAILSTQKIFTGWPGTTRSPYMELICASLARCTEKRQRFQDQTFRHR